MPLSAPEPDTIEGIGLVLGGARSGKSAFAEKLLSESGRRKIYLATATASDGEMEDRIAHHQARRGPEWSLVEEPLEIATVIRERTDGESIILVDCLTLWVTNLMMAERDLAHESALLCRTLAALGDHGGVVLVSNEVGQGIVPIEPMARQFRDHAGRLHQQVAELADSVWFLTAGLARKLK